jgi:hypothetical protein
MKHRKVKQVLQGWIPVGEHKERAKEGEYNG